MKLKYITNILNCISLIHELLHDFIVKIIYKLRLKEYQDLNQKSGQIVSILPIDLMGIGLGRVGWQRTLALV